MNAVLSKKACGLSKKCLSAYFEGQPHPFKPYAAPDFFFIPPDLAGTDSPPPALMGTLSHPYFEVLTTHLNHCTITGTFYVLHCGGATPQTACRATLIWATSSRAITLTHCHLSSALTLQGPEEKFPIDVGVEGHALYALYHKRIQDCQLLGRRCCLTDHRRQTHFLYYTDIITLMAQGQQTICQCQNGQIVVNTSLSTLEDRLPGAFVRIQRSLIINTLYLMAQGDCTITLAGGVVYALSPKYGANLPAYFKEGGEPS